MTLPPPPPRIYRWMSALAGPLEKILGLTCRDFTQLASEKLDRPLTTRERYRYFIHRLVCSICCRQEKRMRQINRLANYTLRRSADDLNVKLESDVRERIRERVSREMKHD